LSIELSIVIPAFNEEKRLPQYLRSIIADLPQHFAERFEVIVVDDGSSDNTTQIATYTLAPLQERGRVLTLKENKGKGAAVKTGIYAAVGRYVCVTDADGSAGTNSFRAAFDHLSHSQNVGLVGIRYGTTRTDDVGLSFKRKFLGKIFAFLTRIILGLNYRDTQCGFKVFKREFIQAIVPRSRMDRFGLDFELLYIASIHGVEFDEFETQWHEMDGSKVNPFKDGMRMLLETVQVRLQQKADSKLTLAIDSMKQLDGILDYNRNKTKQVS
jgi:dolichyl-phosphate beta-glucosyltransferase